MTLRTMLSDMGYRARSCLTGHRGRAVAILFIAYLLGLGTATLGGTVTGAAAGLFPADLTDAVLQSTPEAALLALQAQWVPICVQLGTAAVVVLFSALICWPLDVGIWGWYERCVCKEPMGLSGVFSHYESFRRYVRAAGTRLWIALLRGLWRLVFLVPVLLFAGAAAVLFSMTVIPQMRSFYTLFVLLGAIAVLGAVLVALGAHVFLKRYELAAYLLAKDPQLRGGRAVRLSRKMMRGHRWQSLALSLSFLGWLLLSIPTLGLLLLYVIPYYRATKAIFFEYVIAADQRRWLPKEENGEDIPDAPGDGLLYGKDAALRQTLETEIPVAQPEREETASGEETPGEEIPPEDGPTAEFIRPESNREENTETEPPQGDKQEE